jgi:4-amino-4-deoxy-L-arabinose transferase-like glycosyltransferase
LATNTDKASLIATDQDTTITLRRVLLILAGLFLLNLLLRVFYLRFDFVNGDETVRALTAARVLDGAYLYADIVTDKPPGTTYFYAAVFALFGRSMKAVHLAAAVWNFATAVVVYLIAVNLYNRRTALWAALAFVYFSTNYFTQDMMAANTELLMALPYTAAFYFFIKAHHVAEYDSQPRRRRSLLFVAAGVMTGAAAMFKQVAVFNLAFFALYEIAVAFTRREQVNLTSNRAGRYAWIMPSARQVIGRLLLIAAGFAVVIAMFFGWLTMTGALRDFWRYAVVLGTIYVGALPENMWLSFFLSRVSGYVLFNAALWGLAIWTVARALIETKKHGQSKEVALHQHPAQSVHFRFDLAIALWAVISLSGVITSGRFFGHYFIQVLPALALLASRGIMLLSERLRDTARRRKAQVVTVALVLLFLFGFVRIHHRTAILAYETVTGARTRWSEEWGMTVREREAEEVSHVLRNWISEGEPLYIWDYGLDVYWRTGARPASRYLTPYYITGRFPEISTEYAPPDEPFWPEARTNLVEDLKSAKPRFILDVSGTLVSLPYREVVDFIKANYRFDQNIGPDPARPFAVYRLKSAAVAE